MVAPCARALAASWPALRDLRAGAGWPSGRSRPGPCSSSRTTSTPREVAGTGPACTSSAQRSTSGRAGTATGTSGSPSRGYGWPSSTPAFFPLYPLLVAGLGRVLGEPLPPGRPGRLARRVRGGVRPALSARAARASGRRTRAAPCSTSRSSRRRSSSARSTGSRSSSCSLGDVRARRARAGSAGPPSRPGLALLTRAQGVALLPALAVFAWRSGRRARDLALLAVPAAMFLAFPVVLEAWVGHGARLHRRTAALGALARAARPARRPRAGDRRGRRRGALLGGGDARCSPSSPGACSARRTALYADRRARDSDGAPVRAARRALLASHASRSSAFPCLVALAVLGRDRRVHVSVVAVLARGSRSAWFDGRCGTGSPDGGAAVAAARLDDPRHGPRRALVRRQPRRRRSADDVLYQWSTAVGGVVQYAIILAVVLLLARGIAPATLGLRPPASWARAVGWIAAALVTIWVVGAILNIFLKAGRSRGSCPTAGTRAARRRSSRTSSSSPRVAPIRRGAHLPRPRLRRGPRRSRGDGGDRRHRARVRARARARGRAARADASSARSSPGCACKTDSVYPSMILHALFNGGGAHRGGDGVSERFDELRERIAENDRAIVARRQPPPPPRRGALAAQGGATGAARLDPDREQRLRAGARRRRTKARSRRRASTGSSASCSR